LARAWLALSQATATAVSPSDSDESQWGLDPIALLIVKLATAPIAVGALIQRASGGDSAHRAECLVAIDLVYWLGLLAVDGGVLSSSGDTGGRGLRSRGSATEEDPRLSRLRQALAAMEGQNPVDVLGLGDRALIDAEEVARAYREQSRTYHPDHYQGAPPLLRALAEACFARLNAAQEALAIPGGLAEAQSLLAARAEGRPFVTARDGQRARVAFRRGETLFHNRDWRGADAQFQEAVAKDPSAWPHALYAARAGYLSKRLSAAHAVDALDGLVVEDARRRAEVQVAVGNILKLEGRVGEALRRFHAALDLDAENRDAQREIRPARSREGEGGADPSGSALISNLLKRRES
jgi:curved DNA-binding protein CbpA